MKKWHWIVLGVLAAVSVLAQALAPHHVGGHWWDAVPGSYSAYGFLGCAAIVIISKWIGKRLVQRREDYYDAP